MWPLAPAALATLMRLIPGVRTIDDAYITFRYAANIAHGAGFVYNPGQHVLGTTTPLYTTIMALAALLAGAAALPAIAAVVNALLGGVSAALLTHLGRQIADHPLPGVALGALWAVAPMSVTFAVGGMETELVIALMLGAFAAWLAGRTTLAAALTGLAVLTRPDALIWAGPLALGMIYAAWVERRDRPLLRRLPWREALTFAAVVLPWVVYGTLTFGSPLTHSVAAKSVAYLLPPTQALVRLLQSYATPFFGYDTFGPPAAMIGAVLYPLLALFGALFMAHRDWRTLPLSVYPWLYFLVFAVANPLMFRWYLAPPMPVFMLCIVAGLWGIVTRVFRGRARYAVLAAASMLWLATSLLAWDVRPDHGPDRPAPNMAWFKLELLYEEAAKSLAPEIDADTVVAAADIGAVGWYSEATILDTLGLISPVSSTYYPIDESMLGDAPYAVAPDLIADQQPDFIILLETYARNGLLKDPRFEAQYRLRDRIDTDIYDSQGMLIFERRGR